MVKAKVVSRALPLSQNRTTGGKRHRNSNVWNILPVSTLRTIDLGSKKNSNRLFSRFCGKLSVFFEVFLAPKLVQLKDCHPDRSFSFPKEMRNGVEGSAVSCTLQVTVKTPQPAKVLTSGLSLNRGWRDRAGMRRRMLSHPQRVRGSRQIRPRVRELSASAKVLCGRWRCRGG